MENVFLSDEFVKFSEDMKAIHEEKKREKEKMKKVYEEYENVMNALDERAKSLTESWEEWSSNVSVQKKAPVKKEKE